MREGDGKMGEIAHDTLASLGLLSHDKENLASENTSPSEPSPVREPKASQLHTITLRVEGITDGATRAVVERALIGVHGVISVTVDQRRSHAVVCTRTPESVLTSITDALRAHGTDATPVAVRRAGCGRAALLAPHRWPRSRARLSRPPRAPTARPATWTTKKSPRSVRRACGVARWPASHRSPAARAASLQLHPLHLWLQQPGGAAGGAAAGGGACPR